MDSFTEAINEIVAFIERYPIDLALLLLIAFMFGRFVWIMVHRTKVWDNLSRSLVLVFGCTAGVYLYSVSATIFGDYPGERPILWALRILILFSITWCQFELNKELKRMPRILFTRDRIWVRDRVKNVELIRSLLIGREDTPDELIDAIDRELEEMYRFKDLVRKEDEKLGIYHNQDYLAKEHGSGPSSTTASITKGESPP